MLIRKSSGPSTDPRGTPDETGIGLDEDPFTMTDWWRLSRNPLTRLDRLGLHTKERGYIPSSVRLGLLLLAYISK